MSFQSGACNSVRKRIGLRGPRGQSGSSAVLFLSGFNWRIQLLSISGVSFGPGLILGRWDLHPLAAWFPNLLRSIPHGTAGSCFLQFMES